MENLSDYLRRLATTLDDDFHGNVLRVMQHLLEIVKDLIASECVCREWNIRNKAGIQQVLDDWHQERLREAYAAMTLKEKKHGLDRVTKVFADETSEG